MAETDWRQARYRSYSLTLSYRASAVSRPPARIISTFHDGSVQTGIWGLVWCRGDLALGRSGEASRRALAVGGARQSAFGDERARTRFHPPSEGGTGLRSAQVLYGNKLAVAYEHTQHRSSNKREDHDL